MIKSIKINLFEKNRNEVFNEISVEDKKKNIKIFINKSNKHLNGNIIDEYIKLLAKPPQLELGLSPHNQTATLEALTTYENFNIYENNKTTISDISENDLIKFLTIDGTNENLQNFINKAKTNVISFLKSPEESKRSRPKPRDFYDLVKRINTKLREINEKLKKNNNYFVDRIDDEQKIKDQKKIEERIYNRIQDQDKHTSRDIRNIKNPTDIFRHEANIEDLFEKLDNKLLYDKNRQDSYDRERDSILKQYWKYCFPNKKFDLSTFITEEQKKTVITFYNIYFILKNYYLIDTTKITYTNSDNSNTEEYLIKNFDLLDLNNKDLTNSNIDLTKIIKIKLDNTIEVTFQCVLNRLFDIPNLKINFNFHNIENGIPKQDKTIIFNKQLLPKMIDPSFNNYDKYYIDLSNNINYKTSQENYEKILLKVNKKQKRTTNLLNKNDFFFNQTLTDSFIKDNTVKDDKDKKDKDKKDKDNKKRFENIYYLLINHFNLLNKKILINNDYYLIEEIFLLEDTKQKDDKNKGTFINVFNNKQESFNINNGIKFIDDISYINIDNTDEKEADIHSIYLLFYVYKLKDKNETITLKRRVITEGCLDKASKLDSYFKDSLYKALQLNDEYLSNRLKQRGGIRVITKKYRNKKKRTTKKKKNNKKK